MVLCQTVLQFTELSEYILISVGDLNMGVALWLEPFAQLKVCMLINIKL